MIRLAFVFQPAFCRQLISVPWKRVPMHKTPAQIARSLRAFRNAHRLGLLRSVRILPGRDACNAARRQTTVEYMGNVVPRLPLAQCTHATCECGYLPVGGGRLMDRLRAIVNPSPGRPSKPKLIPIVTQMACASRPNNLSIGITADKIGFWPATVCPLMTHSGHWLCTAAMVLMPVSTPFEVLV